jgi:NitT/TauT family transport system ATP-binding protein
VSQSEVIHSQPSGPAAEPVLSVRALAKTYNAGQRTERSAIADVSFDVAKGEFVCVVGPSGCGKTTLLRCLSGLLGPTSGEVRFEGTRLTTVPDRLSVVFQDYSRSLFPWLSVHRNVAVPLKVAGVAKQQREARIREVLDAVGLLDAGLGDVGRSYPWQLSGGMQQRVAIARALAHRPDLLLMDEPFASVDAQTRFDLEDLILRVRRELGITVVLVTHDIDEAVYLADRVVVLGRAPSRVTEILDVPLEHPRTQVGTRSSDTFGRLRGRLMELVTRA